MSNIGRAIIKKLAVKFEGNEILSIDNYDVFACYRDLWKSKLEKNQRVDRADSRIRLQWCQEITFHKCAKMAQY